MRALACEALRQESLTLTRFLSSLSLLTAGKISRRVFSFYLTSDNPTGSEFVMGEPDMALAGGGNLTYMDLASTSGMWLLSMQGVKIGQQQVTSYCPTDCAVLIDTGTSFVGMPTDAFLDFARRISAARPDCSIDSGSGLIRCDRDTSSGLPPISFSLQGHAFTLQGSDYYQQGVLGFMAIDVGSRTGFWILGDTFLKTYYTVFDMDTRQIGIGQTCTRIAASAQCSRCSGSFNTGPNVNACSHLALLSVPFFLFVCSRRQARPSLQSP